MSLKTSRGDFEVFESLGSIPPAAEGADSLSAILSSESNIHPRGLTLPTLRSARWKTVLPLVMALSGCAQDLTIISSKFDTEDTGEIENAGDTGDTQDTSDTDTSDTDTSDTDTSDPDTSDTGSTDTGGDTGDTDSLQYVIGEINLNSPDSYCIEESDTGSECLIWYAGNEASVYEIATIDLGISYQDIEKAVAYWSDTSKNVQGTQCAPVYSSDNKRYECSGYKVDETTIEDIAYVLEAEIDPGTGESAPDGFNPGAVVIITHSGTQSWSSDAGQ